MKNKLIVFVGILTLILTLSGCSAKVEKIIVEDIPTLNVGETHQIKYVIEPENATDQTVSFTVSDEKIAVVDTKGAITAVAPGSVEICILPNDEERTTPDDTKTGTKISVTVIQPVETVQCKPELTIAVGKNADIEAAVFPENSSDKTLIYKSSDESVATVDAAGMITGLKKGESVVTVASANGLHAECKVTIKQPVAGIKLDKESLELAIADTVSIKATLNPKDADINTDVTFSSSNKNVATVDAKGKITALSEGETTIAAAVLDVNGKKITAKCVVSVFKPYHPEPEAIYNESNGSQADDSSSNNIPSNIIGIQPFVSTRCPACAGSGIMISGTPCYICGGTGRNPELDN